MKNEMTEVALNKFAAAFATRVAYETSKQNDALTADNMTRLNAAAAFFSHVDVAALLNAANVDADTINRVTRADKRFAIYSIMKAHNVLSFVLSSAKLNDMNFYILKTALKCAALECDMSLADAQAACSADVKLSAEQKKRVVQNSKHIAASTVKSQHASTLDALIFLNVLTEKRDNMNNATFALNKDNAIAAKLIERLS